MRNSVKRIIIAIIAVIILFAFALGYFVFRMKTEISIMTPVATGLIVDEIYAVKDSFVNLYLIKTSEGFIAIDAGNDSGLVSEEMEALPIDPALVNKVLLTHSDSDHVAAAKNFVNAAVYLPKLEEQMVDGRTSRFFIFGNSLDVGYNLLNDKQVLTFGELEVRCIASPGHTPGSMSFLVNNSYLFVGDSLSLKNGKVELFNDFFNMDNQTQTKSLLELSRLSTVSHIFTAHYGFTDDFEHAFNDFK